MKPQYTALILTAALVAACERSATTESTASSKSAETGAGPSAALAAVIAAQAPAAPQAIQRVRDSAKPGDTVTLSGRVMGNMNPFTKGRAAFILGDPALLTACNDIPGDECETPWDNCCDSPEDKKRGTATIQVVDADGRVLRENIEGVGGIEKLAALTITGTVADSSTPDALIINASAIHSAIGN
jgi:hypothetical protein